MLTRRTFVTSAATFGYAPLISGAQTPVADQHVWPTIQGDAVDSERTRVVDAAGIVNQPGEVITVAEDLAFPRTTEGNSSVLLSQGVVIAHAMGPDLPLIAIDANSGTEIWRTRRVSTLISASGNLAAYVIRSEHDLSLSTIHARQLTDGEKRWEIETGNIANGVIFGNDTLITVDVKDDERTIFALDLATGSQLWSQDISQFGSRVPGVFASNGEIVLGSTIPANQQSIKMAAWSLEAGEQLWEIEDEKFLSSPAFMGDEVVILATDGIRIFDAETGSESNLLEIPDLRSTFHTIAVTNDAAILMNRQQITSVSWHTGEILWARPPLQPLESNQFLVCDDVIYCIEESSENSRSGTAIVGYRVDDGGKHFSYSPVNANGEALEIASFLVADGNLYLATDQGFLTVLASEDALQPPPDPVMDRELSNPDLGFSYSWSEDWVVTGTSFMTPNGQTFSHESNGAVAAQSAGEDRDGRSDFTGDWHANLGPDSRYIRGIGPMDAPSLDFVPEAAEVLAVEYGTTFDSPYDHLYGIRVLVPLTENNVLVFEFLQASSLFYETLESFSSFFENLEIV